MTNTKDTTRLIVILAIILLIFALQSFVLSSYLDDISTKRGALLQAIIYAAQTVLLILVLRASLAQLSALQKSTHGATVQQIFSTHRDIAKLGIDKPEIVARLAGSSSNPEIDRQAELFVDMLINHAYSAFIQNSLDLIPTGLWEAIVTSTANLFDSDFVRDRWRTVRKYYETEFQSFIDTFAEEGTKR